MTRSRSRTIGAPTTTRIHAEDDATRAQRAIRETRAEVVRHSSLRKRADGAHRRSERARARVRDGRHLGCGCGFEKGTARQRPRGLLAVRPLALGRVASPGGNRRRGGRDRGFHEPETPRWAASTAAPAMGPAAVGEARGQDAGGEGVARARCW